MKTNNLNKYMHICGVSIPNSGYPQSISRSRSTFRGKILRLGVKAIQKLDHPRDLRVSGPTFFSPLSSKLIIQDTFPSVPVVFRTQRRQECLCSSSAINGWAQHIPILKVHSCQYYVLHCNAWWRACWQWRKIWSLLSNIWGFWPWDLGMPLCRWCLENFPWGSAFLSVFCLAKIHHKVYVISYLHVHRMLRWKASSSIFTYINKKYIYIYTIYIHIYILLCRCTHMIKSPFLSKFMFMHKLHFRMFCVFKTLFTSMSQNPTSISRCIINLHTLVGRSEIFMV